MQEAEIVLSILDEKSSNDRNFVFKRLYRILFNTKLYEYLSRDLKNTLEKNDVVRISQNLKKEKLKEIFSCENYAKAVCELTTKILDALYEPLCIGKLSKKERKFKDLRSRFSFMKEDFSKTKYFIEVLIEDLDLKALDKTLNLIFEKKIEDGRFLSIIRKNIEYFGQIDKRQALLLKKVLNHAIFYYICDEIADKNTFEEDVSYCIYNERLIFSVKGNITKVLELEKKINIELNFLFKNTKTSSNVEVKDINTKNLIFAGFEITKSKDGKIFYLMPLDVLNKALKPFFKDGKIVHFNSWINLSVETIIAKYKAKIKPIEIYYKDTENFGKRMKKLKYHLELSLLKTIARKEKISVKKVLKRYGKNLLDMDIVKNN